MPEQQPSPPPLPPTLFKKRRVPGEGLTAGLEQKPKACWESDGIALRYEDSTERLTEVEHFIDVTFYPEGSSSGGTLIFSWDDRHTRIVIDPFTGRISSEETNASI